MSQDLVRLLVAVVISFVFVGAGLYILAEGGHPDLQKAATGWIGLILGYWLR